MVQYDFKLYSTCIFFVWAAGGGIAFLICWLNQLDFDWCCKHFSKKWCLKQTDNIRYCGQAVGDANTRETRRRFDGAFSSEKFYNEVYKSLENDSCLFQFGFYRYYLSVLLLFYVAVRVKISNFLNIIKSPCMLFHDNVTLTFTSFAAIDMQF